jgi:hypothetical protein
VYSHSSATELAGRSESSAGSLNDQFAFHLGEAGHDVEEEAAGRCSCLGVDPVRQTAEVNLTRFERIEIQLIFTRA